MIYILDKNVLEDMKNYSNADNSEGLLFARKIDKPNVMVSAILAVFEGDRGSFPGKDEVLRKVSFYNEVLKKFFKLSKCDSGFWEHYGNALVDRYHPFLKNSIESVLPIVTKFQELLSRTYSIREAEIVFDELESIRKHYALSQAHPLFICAVACLYGHYYARKVLKPKVDPNGFSAYNASIDFRLIIEYAYIRYVCLTGGRYKNKDVAFYTRDSALKEMVNLLQVEVTSQSRYNEKLEVRFVCKKLPKTLFPMLQKHPAKLNLLMEKIKGPV